MVRVQTQLHAWYLQMHDDARAAAIANHTLHCVALQADGLAQSGDFVKVCPTSNMSNQAGFHCSISWLHAVVFVGAFPVPCPAVAQLMHELGAVSPAGAH
jgi:cytosine/adenosine deaminase-related metal-dependent hydrolase